MRKIPENRKKIETKEKRKIRFKFSPLSFFLKWILKLSLIEKMGFENASSLQLNKIEFNFKNLPKEFDNFKILFLTDLHVDSRLPLDKKINSYIESIECDLILLGGDYFSSKERKKIEVSNKFKTILSILRKKCEILAVLGNNDRYDFGKYLEANGVKVLINDNIKISRKNSHIYICGVDDSHSYKSCNIPQSLINISENSFKILLSHSPDCYKEALDHNFSLLLSGHTHGGQICLPGRIHIISQSSVPRNMVYGKWQYKKILGYTSSGAGSGVYPVRFNCPPEIVLITLKVIKALK